MALRDLFCVPLHRHAPRSHTANSGVSTASRRGCAARWNRSKRLNCSRTGSANEWSQGCRLALSRVAIGGLDAAGRVGRDPKPARLPTVHKVSIEATSQIIFFTLCFVASLMSIVTHPKLLGTRCSSFAMSNPSAQCACPLLAVRTWYNGNWPPFTSSGTLLMVTRRYTCGDASIARRRFLPQGRQRRGFHHVGLSGNRSWTGSALTRTKICKCNRNSRVSEVPLGPFCSIQNARIMVGERLPPRQWLLWLRGSPGFPRTAGRSP